MKAETDTVSVGPAGCCEQVRNEFFAASLRLVELACDRLILSRYRKCPLLTRLHAPASHSDPRAAEL